MSRISLLLLILLIPPIMVVAADRKFPYDAIVDDAEEFVRSGPGQKFYPTIKLQRGAKVTVHRHDPGGWAMIDPPDGSFSWVQAEYVKRKQGDLGTLTDNNVIVRVGSTFNDERDWYQRELNKGDAVEILGEKTFETDRGPVKMLKIKPPANEYRWIMGRALVPVDAPVKQPVRSGEVAEKPPDKSSSPLDSDVDPFAVESTSTASAPTKELPIEKTPTLEPPTEVVRQTGPATEDQQAWRARLATVDEEFRKMIKEDPPQWDLAKMEQQYRQLEDTAELPAWKTQLQQRLQAVERYANTKTEYDEFVRVTTETKQHDAQLMSLSGQPSGNQPAAGTSIATPRPNLGSPNAPRPTPAVPTKFDGAGIVQRSSPGPGGKPGFVLITPEGKRLAYLQGAPGVDLNAYVGQSMGVIGQRSYRPELQGELIVVRSMTPVRLRGN